MEKTPFKAESKRLLDLMINSIYTHKEIFLREIISNASDATDKRYYNALQKGETGLNRESLTINIAIDKENRVLTVSDKGCGMTAEELENNLGIIAQSGSLAFKQDKQGDDAIDIIGQFGVGFYSAFMVSDHVKVVTKSEESETAYLWESDGADGYTITPCEKDQVGTDIIMTLKPNHLDDVYDDYLDERLVKGLIKKYSDYIRYPITMAMEKSQLKEGASEDEPEYETITEIETLNSMVPLWKRAKNQITEEEYNQFYQDKFMDYQAPAKVIHTSVEGLSASYNALLYIPNHAPYDFYSKDYEKGLQLYASGVLIMEKCSDLLPDYFSFVKGLVDSQDLSLNISREMLQHDRQLKIIALSLEKKITSQLESMLKDDREAYLSFYKNFGLQLKYGVYSNYGAHKDLLKDLVLFYSSTEEKLVTLAEYVSRMKEEQKDIYYACGVSVEQINHLPQIELLKDKGLEVLYLTDDIDEFALKMLMTYEEKNFKSISDGDLNLESEEEKEEANKKAASHKDLLDYLSNNLADKVKAVKLSARLKSHPVCLSTQGPVSLEMEKVLNMMPQNEHAIKAERILEINADHPIFQTLCALYETDQEKVKTYGDILYAQALLIEGLAIEDPVAYANAVCDMMIKK